MLHHFSSIQGVTCLGQGSKCVHEGDGGSRRGGAEEQTKVGRGAGTDGQRYV